MFVQCDRTKSLGSQFVHFTFLPLHATTTTVYAVYVYVPLCVCYVIINIHQVLKELDTSLCYRTHLENSHTSFFALIETHRVVSHMACDRVNHNYVIGLHLCTYIICKLSKYLTIFNTKYKNDTYLV